MKLLTEYQTFILMLEFITDQLEMSDGWQVRDVLSDINTDEDWILRITGGPTADPAAWQVWEIFAQEVLENIIDPKPNLQMLTKEQALKAMQYFLEDEYYKKDNETLLNVVLRDLSSKMAQGNIEKSQFWKTWQGYVDRALKYDRIFAGYQQGKY